MFGRYRNFFTQTYTKFILSLSTCSFNARVVLRLRQEGKGLLVIETGSVGLHLLGFLRCSICLSSKFPLELWTRTLRENQRAVLIVKSAATAFAECLRYVLVSREGHWCYGDAATGCSVFTQNSLITNALTSRVLASVVIKSTYIHTYICICAFLSLRALTTWTAAAGAERLQA